MNLQGKNVAICGAFGGIGREICNTLLEHGVAKLAALDLKEDSKILEAWKSKYPKQITFYVPIDVTKRAIVENAVKMVIDNMKKIDIFINSSGILDDRNPELTMQVNLLGTIYTTLAAVDHMGKHNGGNGGLIVNVASAAGLEPCFPFAIYAASKHGIVGFTRSLADEYNFNKTGVKFLLICPGITDTIIVEQMHYAPTFEYALELGEKLYSAKKQNADICGKNIVKTIESDPANGSMWVLDLDTVKEAIPKKFWEAKFD